MFIDIECENLLNDGRLKKAVDYRALIFSKASSQHFFDYLESLEFGLSDDVKCWSEFLYELRPNKDLGQPSGG
jgi:hypothetical protein